MEIERKFLLDENAVPAGLTVISRTEITQVYISIEPVIRIRKEDDVYTLTVKGEGFLFREEFELPLTKEQYDKLLLKKDAGSVPIVKTRSTISVENDLLFQVDVYFNELKGLRTVEVEFSSTLDANGFIPPFWFGKEVTFDKNFSNARLSQHGCILS